MEDLTKKAADELVTEAAAKYSGVTNNGPQAELTRRLMVSIKNLDKSTRISSCVLIILTIILVFLTIVMIIQM